MLSFTTSERLNHSQEPELSKPNTLFYTLRMRNQLNRTLHTTYAMQSNLIHQYQVVSFRKLHTAEVMTCLPSNFL